MLANFLKAPGRVLQSACSTMLVVLLCFVVPASHADHLGSARLCVDHYPPYQSVTATDEAEGISVEFVSKVVNQLNSGLELVIADTLEQCLRKAERGEVDLIAGLHASNQRRQFLDFYRYSDGYSNTLFVTKRAHKPVTQLKDLFGQRVGVIESHTYFPEFDEDIEQINKVVTAHIGELVYALQTDKISVMAISAHQWLAVSDIVNEHNEYRVVDFQQPSPAPVHLALSKRSQWGPDRELLAKVIDELYRNKYVELLIGQHYAEQAVSQILDGNFDTSARD